MFFLSDLIFSDKLINIVWKCEIDTFEMKDTTISYTMKRVISPQGRADLSEYIARMYLPENSFRYLLVDVTLLGLLGSRFIGSEPTKVSGRALTMHTEDEIKATLTNMVNQPEKTHANLLIFDKKKMILERYEPNGATTETCTKPWFSINDFDRTIRAIFESECRLAGERHSLTMFSPYMYWKGQGIQRIIKLGYCFILIIVWLDLRLRFRELLVTELSRIVSKSLKIGKADWLTLAETYLFGMGKEVVGVLYNDTGIAPERFPLTEYEEYKETEQNTDDGYYSPVPAHDDGYYSPVPAPSDEEELIQSTDDEEQTSETKYRPEINVNFSNLLFE